MRKREEGRITIGELKRHLEVFPDDAEIYFGGLEFYRTKQRSDKQVQIEFSENVYRDDKTGIVSIDNLINWDEREQQIQTS